MKEQEKIKMMEELTLALLYLTSWHEEKGGQRSWKTYDFDVLEKLKNDGLVAYSYSTKILDITDSGMATAQKVIEKMKSL